ADSANLAARVALGELFLEKYNTPDAAATLEAVLAVNPNHPDALLALARLRQADGAPGAMQLAERALVANRNHAGARAFRARLLFELEDLAAAERDAAQALTVEPGHPEALAVQAAARHLRLDRAAATAGAAQVAGGAPRQSEYFLTLAELS